VKTLTRISEDTKLLPSSKTNKINTASNTDSDGSLPFSPTGDQATLMRVHVSISPMDKSEFPDRTVLQPFE